MSVLVTGARNGLARALCERLDATGLTRENSETILNSGHTFDVVIHCAHSRAKDVTSDTLETYLEDSFDLTQRVLPLCSGTFVLISSISVYPLKGHVWREDVPILLDQVPTFYGVVKLISESRVHKWHHTTGARTLILRLGSMLGPYSPPNVTTRILTGTAATVPLTADSKFSYVFHDEVGDFILAALNQGQSGVFNIAASDTIALGEVARMAGRSVDFGSVQYEAPNVPIDRATEILPALRKSSRERVTRAVSELSSGTVGPRGASSS